MAGSTGAERFFSQADNKKNNSLYSEVAEIITKIRLGGYSVAIINRLEKNELAAIKNMVLELGNNILKEQINSTGFHEAKKEFTNVISELSASKSRFSFIYYAAQLLQYYTVICDKTSVVDMNGSVFNKFLQDNTGKFGDTSKNPLIAEYQLIKYYNELAKVQDTPEKISLSQVSHISEQLNRLTSQVQNWLEDAPDNIFVNYLEFVAFYTCAKALEIQFSKNKSTASEDVLNLLSGSQQGLLQRSQKALSSVDKIVSKYAKEEDNPHGLEFSFGQMVFNKLPCHDLDKIKEHVLSLLQ